MTEQALTALRASIEHWDRMASGKRNRGEDVGPGDCALCKAFNSRYNSDLGVDTAGPCAGCPVRDRTGKDFCADTPYPAIEEFTEGDGAAQYSSPYDSEEFKDLALLELEFLRSLVPQEKA